MEVLMVKTGGRGGLAAGPGDWNKKGASRMWVARGPDTIPGGGLSEKLEPSLAVELRRH